MSAEPTPDELERYRERAITWLDAHAKPRRPGESSWTDTAAAKAFQAGLYAAGYVGIPWPREYGGQGLTETHARVFAEASLGYDLPFLHFSIGLGMCAPTLLDLGTQEQKLRYVPPMLSGETIWCQMFSEPNAGSDVAGLQTKAVRVDVGWQLDGQKVWTSGAHYCDFGLIVARTDPSLPKHKGITMFVLDLTTPGVTIRPLRQITGNAHFNEVFLDNVIIPADALVGEVNAGWAAAVLMLGHERTSVGGWDWSKPASLSFAALRERMRAQGRLAEQVVRRRLVDAFTAERMVEDLNLLHKAEWDAGVPTAQRGSVAKLAGSMQQDLSAEIAYELGGPELIEWAASDPDGGGLVLDAFQVISSGIAGGSNEIQRNIIGERVLGLPTEPRVDRDLPFRDLRVGGGTSA
jgi:alkylation response protein AidB-like acyl-CoA dehydrogenase